MKNTLNELIEKCKYLWNIVQQNRKIKYSVIAGLVGVVIITIGIFTALGINEAAELPTNDTSRPAISTYDKTTIITIGGDESDNGGESETRDDPDESDSDSDTTKDTDDESTEGTEDTVDEPSDNEDTSQNDDPTPAVPSNSDSDVTNNSDNTPTKNTQGTTNNPGTTQSTTKPNVTTQGTTNSPVTTQITTKPQVTTQKPTDPVVNSDAFEVQEKTSDFNGGNVTILNVKNLSSKAYTITIKGSYMDASGKVLKTESKTFEGFPSGWSNYFVFNPGIKYDDFSFELTPVQHTKGTLAQNFSVGNEAFVNVAFGHVDDNGNYAIPTSPEEIASYPQHVCLGYRIGPVKISYNAPVSYSVDIVFFDSDGNICAIGSDGSGMTTESGSGYLDVTLPTKELWENKDKYQLPDNLKNVTAIVGLKYITES